MTVTQSYLHQFRSESLHVRCCSTGHVLMLTLPAAGKSRSVIAKYQAAVHDLQLQLQLQEPHPPDRDSTSVSLQARQGGPVVDGDVPPSKRQSRPHHSP